MAGDMRITWSYFILEFAGALCWWFADTRCFSSSRDHIRVCARTLLVGGEYQIFLRITLNANTNVGMSNMSMTAPTAVIRVQAVLPMISALYASTGSGSNLTGDHLKYIMVHTYALSKFELIVCINKTSQYTVTVELNRATYLRTLGADMPGVKTEELARVAPDSWRQLKLTSD